MKKKFLLPFLILFLSLLIFAKEAFALNAPEDPEVIAVGEGSAKLGWTWPPAEGEGSGTIQRFVLSFRVLGEAEWRKKYPSIDGPNYEYLLMGLTENTTYEWTVMAEATDPTYNSSEVPDPPSTFTTLSGGVGDGEERGPGPGPITPLTNPLKAKTLGEALDAFFNLLFYLATALMPLIIIYGAFLIMTAGGNTEKVNKGKQVIFYALGAFSIILLARALPSIIKGILGG